ncbi:hypothetical protein EV681_4550 [Advenella incenata]|uniref:Uncharacterized protein n=1 Tax=Advenella incenata TaxID=267800 RepID=A0A4Q7V402_9BURK|nr:hypothetical protein [Advenella incenata]RZT91196.1 hypothetical protein EV681_4550 [Advenella incenata]
MLSEATVLPNAVIYFILIAVLIYVLIPILKPAWGQAKLYKSIFYILGLGLAVYLVVLMVLQAKIQPVKLPPAHVLEMLQGASDCVVKKLGDRVFYKDFSSFEIVEARQFCSGSKQ